MKALRCGMCTCPASTRNERKNKKNQEILQKPKLFENYNLAVFLAASSTTSENLAPALVCRVRHAVEYISAAASLHAGRNNDCPVLPMLRVARPKNQMFRSNFRLASSRGFRRYYLRLGRRRSSGQVQTVENLPPPSVRCDSRCCQQHRMLHDLRTQDEYSVAEA